MSREDDFEGDKDESGDSTLATYADATAEAFIGTPSSSGWRREISMLSLPSRLGVSAGWDCKPKSDCVSSLEVTRRGVSRGAAMLSTRSSLLCVISKVREGCRVAGA